MKRKHSRDREERLAARIARADANATGANKKDSGIRNWPGLHSRQLTLVGVLLIAFSTLIVYRQTISVPTIDYEDPFYLVHSPYVHVNAPFSTIGQVWDEPYFANFHPVTTTTWLLDRALADK